MIEERGALIGNGETSGKPDIGDEHLRMGHAFMAGVVEPEGATQNQCRKNHQEHNRICSGWRAGKHIHKLCPRGQGKVHELAVLGLQWSTKPPLAVQRIWKLAHRQLCCTLRPVPSQKSVSVVIASIVGPPFIDECLLSVEKEARELNAEVIVTACGTKEYSDRIARTFPWVRVIHIAERETVPQLRRHGVKAASGEIIAIIEEHCLAGEKWLRTALAAHARGDYAAVGGPILDHAYSRLRDWVVYFCEYNGYLPPAIEGEAYELNGANIAYRRQTLLDNDVLLSQGYWEASLHPALLAKGQKFLSVPGMIVRHRGPFNYGYYLQQRYWFSRAFAGHRAKNLPLSKRLIYTIAAPAVPFLLLARMAGRIYGKKCRVGKFVQALPLVLPALTVYVAGEWVGYLAGPGNALSKVE